MRILLTIWLVLMAIPAQAVTRYIAPAGSDSNDGTTTSTPWLTWPYAIAHTTCGDTLIAMDGTYTITNGAPLVTKVCTASTVYTIQAQNERAAFIDGSPGTFVPFYINNSAYITVLGLHARSGDLDPALGGVNLGVCNVYNSNHVTLRHLICTHPNRYRNAGHVYQFYNSFDNLVEENEAYYFHRHGFYMGGGSSRNVVRRNYCNGRLYPDLQVAGVENPTDGPTETTADDCLIVYPGTDNIFENNIAENVMLKCAAIEAIGTATNNQFLGNICMGANYNGVALDARGATASTMPTNTTVKDMVVIGAQFSSFRFNGNKNTQCINCTVIGGAAGIANSFLTAQPGDGIYTGSITNSLAVNTTGIGIYFDPGMSTWTATNSDAFGNSTNYSPSSSANYTPTNPPTANDPQLGTCQVWRPDGSYAKTHGLGTDILYRYQDGVLTTIPLWDPTTGVFPHGAVVAGLNDSNGDSVYNVHLRLNVNAGGCAFPASYAPATTPTNPPVYVSASGTGSISNAQTIAASQNGMLVFILLRDAGFNVGSLTGVFSSCGGQSFTFVNRATSTPTSPLHAVEAWYLSSPASGTCTISASTTGAVSSWIMTTIQIPSTSGVHASAGNGGNSATPTVTVATNTLETIYSATSGASNLTITAGANQSLATDTLLSPARLAVSTQAGDDGGVMDYVESGTSVWATVAVSMLPTSPASPSSATLTMDKYRFYSTYGTESGASPLSAESTAAVIGVSGEFRLRMEITASVATTSPFGVSFYCQKNGGGYTRVLNNSTSGIRLYGGGVMDNLPVSLTPTTQRFTPTGNFAAGAIIRDDASVFIVPALTAGTKTELVMVGVASLSVGDTVNCQVRKDDGSQLDAYAVTPTLTAVGGRATMGF